MTDALTCVDCHATFVFGDGERRFYEARGLTELPRRCPACRDARKRRARDRFSPRISEQPPKTTRALAGTVEEAAETSHCAFCGLPADLAFRPAIGRPVYCQQCYNWRQKDGAGWRG